MRYFKVHLLPRSTSHVTEHLTECSQKECDISVDSTSQQFWLLYIEHDESNDNRHLFVSLHDTEKDARNERDILLNTWVKKVKVVNHRTGKNKTLTKDFMEKPVRFICQPINIS